MSTTAGTPGKRRHTRALVMLGVAVAIVHFVVMGGTWAQLDSGLVHHTRWQWIVWNVTAFPLVSFVGAITRGTMTPHLWGRTFDLFLPTFLVNSALWGAVVAVTVGLVAGNWRRRRTGAGPETGTE